MARTNELYRNPSLCFRDWGVSRAGITEAHGTALLFAVIFLLFPVKIRGLSQLPTSHKLELRGSQGFFSGQKILPRCIFGQPPKKKPAAMPAILEMHGT